MYNKNTNIEWMLGSWARWGQSRASSIWAKIARLSCNFISLHFTKPLLKPALFNLNWNNNICARAVKFLDTALDEDYESYQKTGKVPKRIENSQKPTSFPFRFIKLRWLGGGVCYSHQLMMRTLPDVFGRVEQVLSDVQKMLKMIGI